MEFPEYRAFDLRSQDMLIVKQLDCVLNHVICRSKETFGNDVYLGHKEFKLIQKSPYLDSDKKAIYDGDFVLYLNFKKEWQINTIYWGGNYSVGWRIKGGKWNKMLSNSHIYNGEVKVIGNIYQNDKLSLILKYGQDNSLLPEIKHT